MKRTATLFAFIIYTAALSTVAAGPPPHRLPAGLKPVEYSAYGDYSVRIYEAVKHSVPISYVEVRKKGTPVWGKTGYWFWLGGGEGSNGVGNSSPRIGTDVTDDGVPDLVISEFTGGAHCSFLAHVFSIGPKFAKGYTLDGIHSEIRFRDVDGDGTTEILLHDWTFAYWNMCFAVAPGWIAGVDASGQMQVHIFRCAVAVLL